MDKNMKPWEVIKLIEETPGRNDKIEILKSQNQNHEFKKGLIACYDAYKTYGVKQIPIKKELVDLPEPRVNVLHLGSDYSTGGEDRRDQLNMTIPQHTNWNLFSSDLLRKCAARIYSGNNARDAISHHMDACQTIDEWNYWYRRILLRDMKCGITAKTINKAYGGNLIKTFGVHLASDGSGKEQLMKDSYIEYKYDGVRCITVVKDNKITYYTRNGKEIDHRTIPDEVHEILNVPEFQGLVFDGELMSKSFQELMQRINKRYQWEVKDIYYAIFDVLPYEEFITGESKLPLVERREYLDRIMKDNPDFFWATQIQIVNYDEADLSADDGQHNLNFYLEVAKTLKFEGLVVKDKKSLWKAGRDNSWLKVKPFIEVSLNVIDIVQGTGKNKDRMGNIICEGTDYGKKVSVSVGSGFTDEQRQEIWDNKDSYIGMIAEIRADAFSEVKEKQNDMWSLRFPRFKGWRGSKPGEKI